MSVLIVIPARFGSTRFPGKPLVPIGGRTMLSRVVAIAAEAVAARPGAEIVVATDHEAIAAHCREIDAPFVMTDPDLPSGSDRALAAARALGGYYGLIVNLQGDAPFTPAAHVLALIDAAAESEADVYTPVVRMTWTELDEFRDRKRQTPFSGTTCAVGPDGRAHWFSKTVIPAIRKEAALRAAQPLSPVWRHIGLYAYRPEALSRFVAAPIGLYEELEGLEQLRFLENGMTIRAVAVAAPPISMAGIDSPEDAAYAERLLAESAEPRP